MQNMEDLKDMLCDELDEIAKKGEVSIGDLEAIEKLTTSIKNIDKIIMADRYSRDSGRSYEGRSYEGRSYDGRGYENGNSDNGYNDSGSYARGRGRHYVRAHYSYADEAGMLSDKLEEMLSDSRMDNNDKRILRQAMEIIRK